MIKYNFCIQIVIKYHFNNHRKNNKNLLSFSAIALTVFKLFLSSWKARFEEDRVANTIADASVVVYGKSPPWDTYLLSL